MRTSRILVAVAASGLLLAACDPTTTVSTSAANTGGAATGAAKTSAAATKPAGLGDTIDVTDLQGAKLAVTLEKVDAKTTATDGFSTPDSGKQYYAAQFQIKNVGGTAWSDAVDNCAKVGDASGQQFQTDIVSSISSGAMFPDTVNLAAGGVSLGWVIFQVPTGDKVTQVQFTPDSGMGESTAQWSLS